MPCHPSKPEQRIGSFHRDAVPVPGQICHVQSRPIFPFRLVVSFSPRPVKSRRPDEPGQPFQPTAISTDSHFASCLAVPTTLLLSGTLAQLPRNLSWRITSLPYGVQSGTLRLRLLSPQVLVDNDIPSNVLSLGRPLRNKRTTT
ncbi:hypothetical protein CORC01_13833 [Colletotrichum orchidophilum]|uniref:Uncharacterized protein n=1 Tax=Colletotrichum orchidophilum TaxID=1209926 RepID=A0A1G4AP24_9PEZI|nr:uncharacterized protein CORC01_13833 [Colletotrichum orchidophilum]OHE90856.1 hypothetical protein CORC01_13833 [Colletotrichum orchidophilum]